MFLVTFERCWDSILCPLFTIQMITHSKYLCFCTQACCGWQTVKPQSDMFSLDINKQSTLQHFLSLITSETKQINCRKGQKQTHFVGVLTLFCSLLVSFCCGFRSNRLASSVFTFGSVVCSILKCAV